MQDEANSCLHEGGGHVHELLSGGGERQRGHGQVRLLVDGVDTQNSGSFLANWCSCVKLSVSCHYSPAPSATHPSDDLTNHAVPVPAGVHGPVAVVLHQVQLVPEAQLLGELSDHVDAVALQLSFGAFGHHVRVLLRKT